MKRLLILLSIVVIFPIFTLKTSADEGIDKYIDEFRDLLPSEYMEFSEPGELTNSLSMDSLISGLFNRLSEGRGNISSFALTLIGITALMSVASLCHDKISDMATAAAGIVCSVLIFSALNPLIEMVVNEIEKINGFFTSLIPVFVGITALGGSASTASVQAVGMSTALSLVGGLAGRIFASLSSLGLALSLLSSFGNEGITSVFKGLKGIFYWATGIFTAILTASFSLQNLIASSADSATLRAAKYAASGLIPVVGSTVSSALSTLASGLSYAKGIVGGGAIAVILYMAIGPLSLLLVYRLVMSLCIILSDMIGAVAPSKMISSFRFAVDMTITVYALSALIYIFEIVIFIRTGVALS